MSAPISPGGTSSASASGSAARIASAPAACNVEMVGRKSRISPEHPGYCSSAPNTTEASRSFCGSPTMILPAERLGACAHDGDRLRVTIRVDKESRSAVAPQAMRHRHRFRGGGCFVEQRSIGDGEAGQVGDHCLEIEQSLEPALADLGLIGRVGRVPGRAFQNIALDNRRQNGPVIALADQRHRDFVFCRSAPQFLQYFRFRKARADAERRLLANRCGDCLGDEIVETFGADRFQHGADVVRRNADVPPREIAGIERCVGRFCHDMPRCRAV